MTRTQPGEVAAYDRDDGGGPICDGTMWLRGPLSDEEALRIATATAIEWERDERPVAVRHTHARNIPDDDGLRVWLSAPGRGAYPVVIVDMEVPSE